MTENNHIRLKPKKKLKVFDAVSSTLAQIAPAAGIYYGLPVIFVATGIGSPLTILVAAIAVAIVGLSLTHFSKILPSSGSLVKYIGLTFGGVVGTASSLVYVIGSIFLSASAFIELGGWTSDSLALYGIHVHWIITTIALSAVIWGLTVIGVDRSTRVAAVALAVEVIVILGVSLLILFNPPTALSASPFSLSSIKGGLGGIGLGFPLAVYLFIGFENSVALSEETENPGKNTTKAVLYSIAIMTIFFIFVSYAITQGFGNNAQTLTKETNPFVTLANKYLGAFSIFAIIAGFTSIVGMTIAALNAFSRIAFHSAREGLIHPKLSKISKWGTPVATLSFITGAGLVIAIVTGIVSKNWPTAFGYLGTLGTIPVLLIYILLHLSVIFYKKGNGSLVRRLVLPIVGIVTILLPIWSMVQPNQPAPLSYFPWAILLVCAASLIYSWLKVKRDPSIPERIAVIVSDRESGEYQNLYEAEK